MDRNVVRIRLRGRRILNSRDYTVILDLLLTALICLLALRLQADWLHELDREEAFLNTHVPATYSSFVPLPKVQPLNPRTYSAIVDNNLLSPDRNSTPTPEPPIPAPPPKPVPPLPTAYGVMTWNEMPSTALLSENGSARQRAYRAGDTVGGF